jgi:PTH1 family peptidyl-tRNA hydrolase
MHHRVIVGLGNPGREYALTRHNLGYLVVEALASELTVSLSAESRFEGRTGRTIVDGVIVDLLLPTTYMNESGRSVAKFLAFYKLCSNQLIVVVDDMALPFGQLRLRPYGTSGGHNGLRSIQMELGTTEYRRLRVGIGAGRESHVEHVLGKFSQEELQLLPECIERSVVCLRRLLKEEFQKVVNDVNRVQIQ